MKMPQAYVILTQDGDDRWRAVHDRAGRLVLTQYADLAAHVTLALGARGVAPLTFIKRGIDQIADMLLAAGVPKEEFPQRMLFVEIVGEDDATNERRAEHVAELCVVGA